MYCGVFCRVCSAFSTASIKESENGGNGLNRGEKFVHLNIGGSVSSNPWPPSLQLSGLRPYTTLHSLILHEYFQEKPPSP